MKKLPKRKETSWNKVADWYQAVLEKEDSYQGVVIWPNLKRLLHPEKGERILDVACGSGFFSLRLAELGAVVTGVDAAPNLLRLAVEAAAFKKLRIDFREGRLPKLSFLKTESFDKALLVLAIENLDQAHLVFKEVNRTLKPGGSLFIVMTHPTFRVPQESDWGWDEKKSLQYRRVDRYLSETKTKIFMHPGKQPDQYTWTFHRPLQFYFKTLRNAGLTVTALEEWISHKKSQSGPRAKAEDVARHEFPLFLYLEAKKI